MVPVRYYKVLGLVLVDGESDPTAGGAAPVTAFSVMDHFSCSL